MRTGSVDGSAALHPKGTERGLQNTGSIERAISSEQMGQLPRQRIGLKLEDALNQRLLEGVATNLHLEYRLIEDEDLQDLNRLFNFEMIIADEPVARSLRPRVREHQNNGIQIKPALISTLR